MPLIEARTQQLGLLDFRLGSKAEMTP
jgi:hypothetical protein